MRAMIELESFKAVKLYSTKLFVVRNKKTLSVFNENGLCLGEFKAWISWTLNTDEGLTAENDTIKKPIGALND